MNCERPKGEEEPYILPMDRAGKLMLSALNLWCALFEILGNLAECEISKRSEFLIPLVASS